MRRPSTRLAVVAAVVVLGTSGAGCAGPSTDRAVAPSTSAASSTAPPAASPSTAPGAEGTAPSAAAGGSSTTGARRPAPATTARPSGGGSTTEPPPTVLRPAPAPPPGDDGSQGPPGAFARTLLRPQPATEIVIERYVQDGADIAAASLSRTAARVGDVAAKPVDVRPAIALDSDDRNWTAQGLRATADRLARTPQGGGRAVLRLVLVRGTFEGSEDVLGVAVRGDVVALFRDNIAGASTPVISGRSIEDAVLLHEFGHVLGLVDLVLSTGRADPDHPGHSRNRGSVMYWAVESSVVGQVLSGGPPKEFDEADLADLRALRNGA